MEQISDPRTWNKYAYVKNNPLIYIDPTGERAVLAQTQFARETSELEKEYDATRGLNKIWVGIKLAFKANELLPTPFALSYERAALAHAGDALEGSAEVLTGLGRNNSTKVLEGVAEGVAFRRPDFLGFSPTFGNILGEAKDVAKLALTGQLRDAFRAAKELNSTLYLFVAEETQFSRPLLQRIQDTGARVYRYVGNEWKDVTDELLKTLRSSE